MPSFIMWNAATRAEQRMVILFFSHPISCPLEGGRGGHILCTLVVRVLCGAHSCIEHWGSGLVAWYPHLKHTMELIKRATVPELRAILIIIIEGLSLLQSISPTTANKQTQAQKKRVSMARKLLEANAKS